jgi:hypothetical protein
MSTIGIAGNISSEILIQAVSWRRHLHRHPELAYHGELRDGAVARQEAATNAGLSERQKVTALRLASVPSAKFDALVESSSPPSVMTLAELGRKAHNGGGRTTSRAERSHSEFHEHLFCGHPDTVRAARARKMFWSIREFCQENAPADLAGAFARSDAELLWQFVADMHRWLDEFAASLPKGPIAGS